MQTSVIYARVSSVGDRQSIDRQVIDLKEYAEYAKLDVKEVSEEHISGAKRNDEREGLRNAISYLCLQK